MHRTLAVLAMLLAMVAPVVFAAGEARAQAPPSRPQEDVSRAAGVTASPSSLKIRVRGTGKIAARASRDQGDLVLAGSLADDSGRALPGESITIAVRRESDPRDANVAEGLRAARACERAGSRALAYGVRAAGAPDAPDVIVITDDAGRFCFRAKLPPDRHFSHLAWRGATLVDAADMELAFDLSRRALALDFDPTPHVVSLDTASTKFEVTALVDDNGETTVAPQLALTLTNERGDELGKATSDNAGRGRFTVPAARLGPPGAGELRVSFAGDTDTAFATHVAEIERHVKVALHAPAAERGELVAQNPEDGILLAVDVTSTAGEVTVGGVEARVGDALVGAAPVERGKARLTLTFAAQGNEVPVSLRYIPSAPWYESLGDSTVRVPIRGPSLLAKAPILVAGLAVLVFFLVGRVATRTAKPEAARTKDVEPRDGQPRIEVVRAAEAGETGWQGTVVDAHEGTALAGVRVWIERGTFEGRTELASTTTNSLGAFTLPGSSVNGGEELVAEGPLHAPVRLAVPAQGEVAISLVLRRRALLARFVKWAKRRGGAFDARPEPTPGHVRRAAGEDVRTAQWAEAVERAVFGTDVVDAHAESEIERLTPGEASQAPPILAAPGPAPAALAAPGPNASPKTTPEAPARERDG